MIKREFCQLSHTYKGENVAGHFASSKLDGFRVIWDGGVSRGYPKADVPWANHDKDSRYVEQPIATGLWTRYGNVVHAPDWFLDLLPRYPMDGELWSPDLSRQQIRSICSTRDPGDGWKGITYQVFNLVLARVWLGEGRINNPNFSKTICSASIDWYIRRGGSIFLMQDFETSYEQMLSSTWSKHIKLVLQKRLTINYAEEIEQMLEVEMAKEHGEGLIITDPRGRMAMKRVKTSLKVKPNDDSEARVIGYVAGRETDKGSRLLGKLGCLIVRWGSEVFELSGFTDAERTLSPRARDYALVHPGEQIPYKDACFAFPVESLVTFKYRGLTDDGIPNEARYWRKYENL